MSTAFYGCQRDVLSRNPVLCSDKIRPDSGIRVIAFSSPNSDVLTHLPVQSSSLTFNRPCLTMMKARVCKQMSSLSICPESFPAVQTRGFHLLQVSVPPHTHQSNSYASCSSLMILPTSRHSEPWRSIQLFIKLTRNTTISIHIDSTSSIYDLKRLIYAHDGIPPCDLRLMHRGRELRDDALLSGLDVDGATITCLLRVLGGRPRTHKLPIRWWFGFSRSYEDGRAGEDGRIRHVLREIKFRCRIPLNWYSDAPLSNWKGIRLHSDCEMRISEINPYSSGINSLPDSIGSLSSLSVLNLSFNKLANVPDSICNLTSLTKLFLCSNQLTGLPDRIGNLVSLAMLDVIANQLTHLPDSVGNLSPLTNLRFARNSLTSLPDWICNLTSVTRLQVSDNRLTLLPDLIGNLTCLTRLGISNNQLIDLPESIGRLAALTRLVVTGKNELTRLPNSVCNLTSLSELLASENQLTCLPEGIGNLTSLSDLNVNQNQLNHLPDSIGNLSSLTVLYIGCNPVSSTEKGRDETMIRFKRKGLTIYYL